MSTETNYIAKMKVSLQCIFADYIHTTLRRNSPG